MKHAERLTPDGVSIEQVDPLRVRISGVVTRDTLGSMMISEFLLWSRLGDVTTSQIVKAMGEALKRTSTGKKPLRDLILEAMVGMARGLMTEEDLAASVAYVGDHP